MANRCDDLDFPAFTDCEIRSLKVLDTKSDSEIEEISLAESDKVDRPEVVKAIQML